MGGSCRSVSRMQADRYGIWDLIWAKVMVGLLSVVLTGGMAASISLRSRARHDGFWSRLRTRQRMPWPVVSLAPSLNRVRAFPMSQGHVPPFVIGLKAYMTNKMSSFSSSSSMPELAGSNRTLCFPKDISKGHTTWMESPLTDPVPCWGFLVPDESFLEELIPKLDVCMSAH
jgi:hypothetical protein